MASQHKEDKDTLVQVQQWTTIMIKGWQHLSYKERLKELGLFSIKTRRLERDDINVYKNLGGEGVVKKAETDCSQ